MKIAISFPGCHRRGGVERVVYEAARHLATRGHRVHILAGSWQEDVESFAQCQRIEHRQQPAFLRGPSYFNAATEFLKDFECDILNTHGVVCPTGGVMWVQSLHAAWLERGTSMLSKMSIRGIQRRLNPLHPMILRLEEKHFRHRAYKKLIATTPAVRDDLNRFYGVPADDVVIIPNGFNPDEFTPHRRSEHRGAMRKKLGLNPDQIVLLFVANELERKGFKTILGALKRLGRKNLRLIAIGKPPKKQVMQLASHYGVADLVIAAGQSASVSDFHAAADLFVLPTQYEAFSLAIIESLGSGLPVVTSSVSGAGDAIQPGINGQIVRDPTNPDELAAVLKPMLDHDTLAVYSAGTPATAQEYQWPTLLAKYEQVLIDASKKQPTKSPLPI
jgi:UDP-glucose:(heptosyl)LPS alpha-1,3-glucosyltransferase